MSKPAFKNLVPYTGTLFGVIGGSSTILFILLIFLGEIIGFVQNILTKNITDKNITDENLSANIIGYIIIELSICVIGHIANNFTAKICTKAINIFEKQAYKLHSNLSFQSKNKADITFPELVKQAGVSIQLIIDWGIPTLVRLVGTIVSCIYMFISSDLNITLLAMVSLNVITYLAITKKQQECYTKLQKERREENNRINALLKMLFPLFVQGDKKVSEITDKLEKIQENNKKTGLVWYNISFITEFSNKLGLIGIGYQCRNNALLFLLMLNTYSSLTNNIQSMINFMNQFSRINSEFTSFIDFWKDLTFKKKVPQKSVPVNLAVEKVNIRRGDFKLMSKDTIMITQGDKIIINGASGSGKTTFLNALLGKINGVRFTKKGIKPEAFSNQIVEMYQTIREKMPFTNISIRDLFSGEEDDSIIEKCLRLCELPFSDFNKTISDAYGEISGGEKTRLALATRLYAVIKKDAKMIVLDEPEQGLDSDVAEKVFKNVFAHFKTKTIIVITHLCKCRLNKFAKWNTKLRVKKGLIEQF